MGSYQGGRRVTEEEKIIVAQDLENEKQKLIIQALRKELVYCKTEIMRLGNAIRELVK